MIPSLSGLILMYLNLYILEICYFKIWIFTGSLAPLEFFIKININSLNKKYNSIQI